MERKNRRGKGGVLWFYGLSGSGKSTLAAAVAGELQALGVPCYILDGDVLRGGLNQDLSMSPEGRRENIRRAAHVARILADAGLVVLAAFITPYRELRGLLRRTIADFPYAEVYLDCGVDACRARDPKGLYAKADAGLIPGFTGVSAPFESAESPELSVATEKLPLERCVNKVLQQVAAMGLLAQDRAQGEMVSRLLNTSSQELLKAFK